MYKEFRDTTLNGAIEKLCTSSNTARFALSDLVLITVLVMLSTFA